MILIAIVIGYPTAVWAWRRYTRWLERRHRVRLIRALLEADVARIVEREPVRIYDWATEPLDPRDVDLYIEQLRGPQANEQIWRELA